jgi:hypothetical protein
VRLQETLDALAGGSIDVVGRFRSQPPIDSVRLRQPWGEDPYELCRGLRSHFRPSIRQVVLHGRVRQAEAVRGRLLRSGDEDGGNDTNLTVRGAFGRATRRPSRHALRSQSNGSGGSASRIVIGRSVVAGLCLSPRPQPNLETSAANPCATAASVQWIAASRPFRTSIRPNRPCACSL